MIAWTEVEGEKTAKARLAAKEYQDPEIRMGNVDIAGSVSRRFSHLRVLSRGAPAKWPLWGLDIKCARLQADVFGCEVFLRAAREWNSEDSRRVWKLRLLAYGSNDAPAALQRPLRKYLVNSAESPSSVGFRFDVSSFAPRMYFVYRRSGSAVGVSTTHTGDISGCGEPDILSRARNFSQERFRKLKVLAGSLAHVGMGLGQRKDFSAALTQADFAKNVKSLPAPPPFWAGGKEGAFVDGLHQIAPVQAGGITWGCHGFPNR